MSNVNMLFYSNKCEKSKNLLALMEKEKLIQFFHLVCVDQNKLPSQIKYIPALMIKGNPTIHQGGDVFIWFSKVCQWKMNMMAQKLSENQKQYISNINKNITPDVENKRILGYNTLEMGSFTDQLAFYSKNIENDIDKPFPQSFLSFDQITESNIITPPLENGSYDVNSNKKMRINAMTQKKMLERAIKERDEYDKTVKESIKKSIDTHSVKKY